MKTEAVGRAASPLAADGAHGVTRPTHFRGNTRYGRISFVATGLSLLVVTSALAADPPPADATAVWLAEHYTKYENRIPMRDGVRLFTRIYVPKDDSQAWPIVLTRTPCALKPYGADNYTDPAGSFETLAKDSFILVTQDVRGRFASEGEYVHVRPFNPAKAGIDTDESSDTWDTIDWLVNNVPGNSGNVGLFGISFRGKFRNSFERPEPFTPGQITRIAFTLPDICHTFRSGHRVMVHVQSTWFPLVDRNPQTFVNIPTAKSEDYRLATHRVYRAAGAASGLTVQVLGR